MITLYLTKNYKRCHIWTQFSTVLTYICRLFNFHVIILETLRVHPPLGSLNKVCTENYTYVPKDKSVISKPVVIEAGTTVILPLYGLHRDPKYFDDPNSFRPERFLGGNKNKIVKYTFMPFGEGPRACLGAKTSMYVTH